MRKNGTLQHGYSPDAETSLDSLLMAVVDSTKRSIDIVMPCTVVDYGKDDTGRSNHEIIVQPLIRYVRTGADDGTPLPKIRCTAQRISCGDFLIDIPIKVGDTGWVISCDRDSTLVKKYCRPPSEENKTPPTKNPPSGNIHEFRHGFFIPDRWGKLDVYADHTSMRSGATMDPSSDRLTIQSLDGKQRISIGTGSDRTININSDETINIKTTRAVVDCDNATLNATTSVLVDTPTTTLTGDLVVDGNVTSHGEITEKRGVVLGTHTHVGVMIGESDTGIPKAG